jgi:mRNA-degrading endonuclease RelE of RelBE toxin-antitoxin system
MTFTVRPSDIFLEQLKNLDEKSKRIIRKKIDMIKENPFHFKSIHSKNFSKVFRVRLTIQKSEKRLIYVIIEPNIVIVCLLERKHDYKDLEKILKKIK